MTEQLQKKIENNTEVMTRLIEKLDQDDILKEKSDTNDNNANRQA